MDSLMSRSALGNVADLGALYDARSDSFCGLSIFKQSIPPAALTSLDNHFSDIQLLQSDTFSEKFHKLDVTAELQVSVLAGLFKLSGSGRYLKDEKSSSRSVKSSLLYNIRTKDDNVNIYHEELRNAFALDAVQSGLATHVVVGITWGANSVVSCEYMNHENKDVKVIEGSLSAAMNMVAVSISGKGAVDFKEGENSKGFNFSIRVFGDVLPRNQELPTSFEGALELMKQMPSLVATCNSGRGMPITYKLFPLSILKMYLNFEMKTDLVVKSLQEATLMRVVQLFEKVSDAKQKLNDFERDASSNKFAISGKELENVQNLVLNLNVEEAKFREKLGKMLSSVRSGKTEGSQLEKLITEFESSPCSPASVEKVILGMSYIKGKIALAKTLSSAGVIYVGFGNSLDDEIIKFLDTKTFVLFFSEAEKTRDQAKWQKNRQVFLQEVKAGGKDRRFLAVDCDIHPKLLPKSGLCIQVLQSGKVISQDLVSEQEEIGKIPTAKCSVPMEKITSKPNNRVPLVIPCTGFTCSPKPNWDWECGKCKEILEYGFDGFFYCGCGRGPSSLFSFKCPDSKHGVGFEPHSENFLKELLSGLRSFKDMNILILGETGVGKSTWINGFINFLTFESLDEAIKHPLCSLVASEFTVCDSDYNEIVVSTGTDTNEVQMAGQSATQDCKVYTFPVGDVNIRLIDTPGIGDTRGVDQDKKNFQNILTTLSKYEELHGICILLKPNNARLTVMFRFCIKELLTYIHRDASQNIMFCFTNTRGTFYKPGDTLPALRNLLKENKDVLIPLSQHTIYCYDSEAFRFLAALKNKGDPVYFTDAETQNFAQSWQSSISETKRMLKHISGLKPHPIQSTLNLNHSREIVVQLTGPLAEISKNIQTNKVVMEKWVKDIQNTKAEIKALEAKRFCEETDLEIVNIDHPKTVCANSACTDIYSSGSNKQVNYKTICHSPCQLQGIPANTRGHHGLLGCAAFQGGKQGYCNCGHNYQEHVHVYYDSKIVTVKVESKTVKESLAKNMSAAELKENMIKEKRNLINENDAELKTIEDANVKFACFLKQNAITPYNDAMLEYLDHQIAEEKSKVAAGCETEALDILKNTKSAYEQQIKILEREMAAGEKSKKGALSPKEIEALVDKLYKLKHNGASIRKALEAMNNAKKNISIQSEIVSNYAPPTKNKKKRFYFF